MITRRHDGHGWRVRPWAAVVLALGLVCAACGSSRTTEEIAAANAALTRSGSGADPIVADDETAAVESSVSIPPTGGGTGAVSDTDVGGDDGGPDNAAGGEGSASPTDAGSAASGQPIKLGSVGTFTGPIGAVFEPGRQGILIWANWVNAHGGINGRPVEVTVADDLNDPSQHLAIVRDMVERQGVVAIVNNLGAFTSTAAVSYLEGVHVPVIGGDSVNPAYTESPVFFPSSSTFRSFVGALATQAYELGARKIGILACAESSFCSEGANVVRDYAKRYPDVEVVYSAQITLTAPDYTAECLAAQSKGVEFLAIGAESATIDRIAVSCARQDFDPIYGVPSLAAVPALAQSSGITRAVSGQGTFPWFSSGVPGIDEFHQAYQTYGSGAKPTSASATAWTSGRLFEAVAKKVQGDITPESLLAAINTIADDDLGGLTIPLTFGSTPHPQPDCFFWIEIKGGKWVAPRGNQPACNR